MLLFAFPDYREMAGKLLSFPGFQPGAFSVERFPNQEMYVLLQTSPRDQNCLLLGSIAPPDERLLRFLFLADTLRNEGAGKVIAVLPYLAYTRQDKQEPAKSFTTPLVGTMLQGASIDEVITFDVHSPLVARLFPMPLTSLSTAPVFTREIRDRGLLDATLVAPDEGAIDRCQELARVAGMHNQTAYLKKKRTEKGIEHISLEGSQSRRAILVDDILDTGKTLISSCRILRLAGVEEIFIMVSHGLFTGSAWMELWDLGVKRIYCTDTVSETRGVTSSRVVRLTVFPELHRAIE